VQDSISERVAAALKVQLGVDRKKRSTENVEAYQLYMKGRFYTLKAIKSETETGISYFQKAIALDSNYALAYAGLADAYRGQVVGGEMPSDEFMPKSRAAALKAIELDDTLAEAHANLGHVIFWYDWDWNAAENQYKRALELDPNSPDALQFYAHLLSSTGRHAEALAKIKRARDLDPLNLRINALEGMFLYYAGQPDEAIITLQKTLELESNHRLANMFAVRAYNERGMYTEAIATRKAREISADSTETIAYSAYALAKSGNLAEARAALDELLKLSTTRYVPPYNFALVYNALGESGKALDYLEKAFAEKDVRMVFLKVEPNWNNLRRESRFIDVMKRMKLDK
jgi:serine/threonine-protein kinase